MSNKQDIAGTIRKSIKEALGYIQMWKDDKFYPKDLRYEMLQFMLGYHHGLVIALHLIKKEAE